MERIFICDYGFSHDWIMGKIADDIQNSAKKLGFECSCGGVNDYDNEEICYHLAYHIAVPFKNAKHNSVFYTHLNDTLQEKILVDTKGLFDSYICMSPEDAEFMVELGFDKDKVFGKILPVRNNYIKPISIGIFSACYPDGRKNEKWLIDFCKNNDDAKLVNFVFIGPGWSDVVNELSGIGISFEWHNVSRKMPFEYQFQQNKLSMLNYYIYMGMDGGAMGTYDAYAQDVPLCVTYDGFHKAVPRIDYPFDNQETFVTELAKIVSSQKERIDFFKFNNADSYVKWLIDIWTGTGLLEEIPQEHKTCISFNNVLEKKRKQYYPLSLSRIWRYFSVKRNKRK